MTNKLTTTGRWSMLWLTVLIFTSCSNNSFEDYIDWCNEEIVTQDVKYRIDATWNHSIPGIPFSYPPYFYRWGSSETHPESLIDVIIAFKDTSITIKAIDYKIIDVTTKRDTPTIEGYETWKKDLR